MTVRLTSVRPSKHCCRIDAEINAIGGCFDRDIAVPARVRARFGRVPSVQRVDNSRPLVPSYTVFELIHVVMAKYDVRAKLAGARISFDQGTTILTTELKYCFEAKNARLGISKNFDIKFEFCIRAVRLDFETWKISKDSIKMKFIERRNSFLRERIL